MNKNMFGFLKTFFRVLSQFSVQMEEKPIGEIVKFPNHLVSVSPNCATKITNKNVSNVNLYLCRIPSILFNR